MRKFLTNTFILAFIVCILSYPLDYLISNSISKSKYYAQGESLVWNDIYRNKINSDVTIYGSSRAWVQISPKILSENLQEKVYNLGMDGSNFDLQYFRHSEVLKTNKHPKLIIVSLDIFSFEKKVGLYNY